MKMCFSHSFDDFGLITALSIFTTTLKKCFGFPFSIGRKTLTSLSCKIMPEQIDLALCDRHIITLNFHRLGQKAFVFNKILV